MKTPELSNAKNIVGIRIRQARQRPSLHLSQVALSHCLRSAGLSVCRTMVSRIESGERYVTDYELISLAKCLCVSTAWLLGEVRFYQTRRKPRRS